MPCPTCDHTMQSLFPAGESQRWYWCPRCGTLKGETDDGEEPTADRPKLVDRCREFTVKIEADVPQYGEGALKLLGWLQQVGIDEAIRRPEHRRPT